MDFLNTLLENSTFPLFTAFILGLMTTISPCPFCSNITAIGFISKDVKSKRTIMLNGLFYVVGKMTAYFLLALIFLFGADLLHVRRFFETYGEPFLGPFLIICGLFMLGIFSFHHHHSHAEGHTHASWSDRFVAHFRSGSPIWSFLLGIVLSLAFCPYSGVIYFGMLIPLSIAQPAGFLLPLVFGLATGLPVLLIAWFLASGMAGLGRLYNKIPVFEVWLRRICALLFIAMGIYVSISVFGGHHHHDHGSCDTCVPHTEADIAR